MLPRRLSMADDLQLERLPAHHGLEAPYRGCRQEDGLLAVHPAELLPKSHAPIQLLQVGGLVAHEVGRVHPEAGAAGDGLDAVHEPPEARRIAPRTYEAALWEAGDVGGVVV